MIGQVKNWGTKHDVFNLTSVIYNDVMAYNSYPTLNWLYDKYQLSRYLNYKSGLINHIPDSFPICLKPRKNFKGMGLNSIKVENLEDYHTIVNNMPISNQDNYFWQTYFTGKHLSMDFVIYKGIIQQVITFQGVKLDNVRFDYWNLIDDYQKTDDIQKILCLFGNKSGIINIETIGNLIIEIHLRMGDICHLPGATSKIIKLYQGQPWTKLQLPNSFFLIPIFCDPHLTIDFDKLKEKLESCQAVKHYQICYNYPIFDNWIIKYADSGGSQYRLCYFCTDSLNEGRQFKYTVGTKRVS